MIVADFKPDDSKIQHTQLVSHYLLPRLFSNMFFPDCLRQSFAPVVSHFVFPQWSPTIFAPIVSHYLLPSLSPSMFCPKFFPLCFAPTVFHYLLPRLSSVIFCSDCLSLVMTDDDRMMNDQITKRLNNQMIQMHKKSIG